MNFLKLRFENGLQVSEIARVTGLEQKPLYRRIEHLLRQLRDRLAALGVHRTQVMSWLGEPGIDVPVDRDDRTGIREERPSL